MEEPNDIRKAILQIELVKEAVKLFGPQIIGVIDEAKPIVDSISLIWTDLLGGAYKRLREEYGCSDETALALLTLSYGEMSKSVSEAFKR